MAEEQPAQAGVPADERWEQEILEAKPADSGESAPQPKDHEIREFVNALVKIASFYAGAQQLRARVSQTVSDFLQGKFK